MLREKRKFTKLRPQLQARKEGTIKCKIGKTQSAWEITRNDIDNI